MRWYLVSLNNKSIALREKSDEHARKRFHKIVERCVAEAVANGAAGGEVGGAAKLYRAGRERVRKVKEGCVEVGTSVDVI
jgi:hypothetical protein